MKYPLSSILQEERKDMTIRECYEKTGSDYESILKRFGSEAMIQRFALKFLKDGSFSDTISACCTPACRAYRKGWLSGEHETLP